MRENNGLGGPTAGGIASTLAGGLAFVLGMAVVTISVARLVPGRPMVGDIVRFDIGRPMIQPSVGGQIGTGGVLVEARRDDGSVCKLDPAVLSVSGGSLVVEQRAEDGSARVRWAGPRSAGSLDCGASAILTMRAEDLQILAEMAGGYGADTRLAMLVPGIGARDDH